MTDSPANRAAKLASYLLTENLFLDEPPLSVIGLLKYWAEMRAAYTDTAANTQHAIEQLAKAFIERATAVIALELTRPTSIPDDQHT